MSAVARRPRSEACSGPGSSEMGWFAVVLSLLAIIAAEVQWLVIPMATHLGAALAGTL